MKKEIITLTLLLFTVATTTQLSQFEKDSNEEFMTTSTNFKGKLTVTATTKNSENNEGKETVQLYLQAPADKLSKPVKELRAFCRTKLLQPGEKEIRSFEINQRDLASFDATRSAWIAETGVYNVQISASSAQIFLTKSFALPFEIIVLKVNDV